MNGRSEWIARLKSDREFRAAYIKAKVAALVPAQIRALRLKSTNPPMPRQRDLAKEAGLHQSRISMFETPGAANVTLETLATLASALRAGLMVKFVPFSEMVRWENEFSQDKFDVVRLERDREFVSPEGSISTARPPFQHLAVFGDKSAQGRLQANEFQTEIPRISGLEVVRENQSGFTPNSMATIFGGESGSDNSLAR